MAGRARKAWGQLTPAYRARMARHGATGSNWATFDRKKARGHLRTPERPAQARKNPAKFPEYVAKRSPKPPQGGPSGPSLADQVIARKEKLFGDYIKFNGTRSARAVRRNPVTKQPPDIDKMRKFLAMKSIQNINWRNDEWAFLFYH